jgi:hypothetical protein
VGIAVFVAAVWFVTTGPFDRTHTPAVPGGATHGPTVTPTMAPDAGWDGFGLLPEGTTLSTPVEGELIASYAEFWLGEASVYADGRVLLRTPPRPITEQRLTPAGVNLVRSGAVEPRDFLIGGFGVPADAWADPESRPYAAARFAVCPSRVRYLLPAPARALLDGKASSYGTRASADASN